MSDELVNLFKFSNLSEGVSSEVGDSGVSHLGDSSKIQHSRNDENIPPSETDDGTDVVEYHEIMTEEFESNDTRIAMIGNVDSGKSTLIGVLTNAALDDGRGGARSRYSNLILVLHTVTYKYLYIFIFTIF